MVAAQVCSLLPVCPMSMLVDFVFTLDLQIGQALCLGGGGGSPPGGGQSFNGLGKFSKFFFLHLR
jgi:hypothetical protein